jgi:hypothetical protein
MANSFGTGYFHSTVSNEPHISVTWHFSATLFNGSTTNMPLFSRTLILKIPGSCGTGTGTLPLSGQLFPRGDCL